MTNTYQTHEYLYEFTPTEGKNVLVESDSYEAIEDFLSTVELAGVEETDNEEDRIEIPEMIEATDIDNPDTTYFVEVTRATLSLFLDFDVRYYL